MKEQIKKKFIEAWKSKDILMKRTYESVIAKITNAEKSGKYTLPLTDENIIDIIRKEIKELDETRLSYLEIPPLTNVENKIIDKVCELDKQIEELKQYLPAMMPEEEVIKIIKKIISTGEEKNGRIIGLTIKETGSLFDKSKIALLVNNVLNGEK